MKPIKKNYKELVDCLLVCLEYAFKISLKIFCIMMISLTSCYIIAGILVLEGVPVEQIRTFDYARFEILFIAFSCIYLMMELINFGISRNGVIHGEEVIISSVEKSISVENIEHENLLGKYFNYDGCTYKINSYKRILAVTYDKQDYVKTIFDVYKCHKDGSMYYTVWTNEELYMALVNDEKFDLV